MDTVDFVLALLAALVLTNVGTAALAYRNHRRAVAAQREVARLVAQSRPRSPQPSAF